MKFFLVIAITGLIVFLLITSTAPLSQGPLSQLFKKTSSHAQTPIQSSVSPVISKKTILVRLKNPEKLQIKAEMLSKGINFDTSSISTADLVEQNLPQSLQEIKKNFGAWKKIDKVFKKALSPDQQLQKIKQNLSASALKRGRNLNETILKGINLSNVYKLTFESEVPVEQIVQTLKSDPDIETAEENLIIRSSQVVTTSPNDPYYLDSYPTATGHRDSTWNPTFDYQWNLKKIGMGQIWTQLGSLTTINVAVVDSGVDYTHTDFGGCTLTQVNNNQCAKIAPGYDYVNNDFDPMDDFGHGTHVAGIIAATVNNNVGVAGMAPNVRILPVKSLDNTGAGTLDELASGIYGATDNGADVINASWAGTGTSQVLTDAFTYAYGQGVVLAVAAGNDNANVANYIPGNITCATVTQPSIDCTLTVAASDENDQRATYSNFGSLIDIAAPGGSSSFTVLSLKSGTLEADLAPFIVGQKYLRLSGTSMATPHVAALAALLLGKKPTLNPDQVRSVILSSSDDLGTPNFDTFFGYGRINAAKSFASLAGVTPTPSATPTSIPTPTLSPSPSSVGLSVIPSSVNVVLPDVPGSLVNGVTILSTGASGFQFTGPPTNAGGAINWTIFSGGIGNGQSVNSQLELYSAVTPGTYSGTAILQNIPATGQITIPVTVRVLATPTPSPTPTTTPTSSPAATPIPGDIDGNNKVDIFDYNILVGNFGKTGAGLQGDLDNNGKVDIFDYNILVGNFGK